MKTRRSAVTVSAENGLATFRLSREHGNAIDLDLVEALIDACRRTSSDSSIRGVLLASSGSLFCPGFDLQVLVDCGREEMDRFMRGFHECLLALYSFPAPVVAALSGHAVAGGCILALTADWRVLRRDAMIGLNEVRVGVPLPYGVAHVLRDSVHRPRLEEVALLGRNYTNEEALATGLVHEVHEEAGFEDHARARLEEFASKDPGAFAATKRYLRSFTLERIRSEEAAHRAEFLDRWFSSATRRRIEAIVEGLRSAGAGRGRAETKNEGGS